MTISACVPCHNNEATITKAVRSLSAQTVKPIEVFGVDDGSTDRSAEIARETGAKVVAMGANLGRGAARAKAIEVSSGDLVLSVDGTAALAPDFTGKVLPWFDDPKMAAVFGRITQSSPRGPVDRWRGRHLYKLDETDEARIADSLITWGVMMRRSAILEVGNFDASLRHSEDAELGERLIAAGWKIGYEPSALVQTLVSNTLGQVMERYWRWNSGVRPVFRFRDYLRMISYSCKVLAARDLRSRDLPSAAFSVLLPHYCAYRTLRRK